VAAVVAVGDQKTFWICVDEERVECRQPGGVDDGFSAE
jgi:hypothetical protein